MASDEYRGALVFFLASWLKPGFAFLDDDKMEKEFEELSYLILPILEMLPPDPTHEWVDSGEANFYYSASINYLSLLLEDESLEVLSNDELLSLITVEQLASMEITHRATAHIIIDALPKFNEFQNLKKDLNMGSEEFDSELSKLLNGEGH